MFEVFAPPRLSDITVAYTHARENSVTSPSIFDGTETISYCGTTGRRMTLMQNADVRPDPHPPTHEDPIGRSAAACA